MPKSAWFARRVKFVVATALSGVCWVTEASAAPITWDFQTTFVVNCFGSCSAPLAPYLALHGTPLIGSVTFDSAAVDSDPDPTRGSYTTGAWSLFVPAFNTTWSSNTGEVFVGTVNSMFLSPVDCRAGCLVATAFLSSQGTNPVALGPPDAVFQFVRLQTLFPTDAIPPAPFPTAGGMFPLTGGQVSVLPFTIQARAVPEPSLLSLIGLATVGALIRSRRRRQALTV
jgi:hypothetical protein